MFVETGKELQVKGLEGELTGIGGNTVEASNRYQDTDGSGPEYEDAERRKMLTERVLKFLIPRLPLWLSLGQEIFKQIHSMSSIFK